jgi:hypothetical protein
MKRKIRLSGRPPRYAPQDGPLARIEVRNRYGLFVSILFCIDSGADVSAIPTALAQSEGIPYPHDEASRATAAGLVGSVVRYRGSLRVRIAGADYSWPCDFLEAPWPSSTEPYGVIGRAGFLDDFAFCIDKPYFTLRRRKWWKLFLPPWTPEHDANDPL